MSKSPAASGPESHSSSKAEKGSEKGSESVEKSNLKQAEHIGKAQGESLVGRETEVSRQVREQRKANKQRLDPDGKPGDATKQQGGRVELTDGDRTLVPGHKGTQIDKSNDGRISKIEYADGTSREFTYGKNGELSHYKARDGSSWSSKDGLHWENDKGGKSMNAVLKVDSDGTFKCFNAGDGKEPPHLNMTRPDGSVVKDNGNELKKALVDLTKSALKELDKSKDGKVDRVELETAIMDHHVTGSKALGAALLFNQMGDKHSIKSQDLQNPKYSEMAAKHFGTLIDLGSRTELKPADTRSVNQNDIIQGCYTDCKFISAMASKAATPEGAKDLLSMVKPEGDGYKVKLDANHEIHVAAMSTGEKMLGARTNSGTLYTAVIEKAYGQMRNDQAKNNAGEFAQHAAENMSGGRGLRPDTIIPAAAAGYGERDNQGMQIMSGSSEVQQILTHRTLQNSQADKIMPRIQDAMNPDAIPKQIDEALSQAMKDHRIVTASVYNHTLPADAVGIHQQHEYTVLDYDSARGRILFRDPKGQLPDKIYEKGQKLKIEPVNNGKNGEFWLSVADANRFFNDIKISSKNQKKGD